MIKTIDSINADDLKDIFNLKEIDHKYIEYIPLKDTQAGFSIKREYPQNISYKPPVTSSGEPDRVALIDVVCYIQKYKKEITDTLKLPIFMTIHLFSRYFSDHRRFDYNYDDQDCPTKESVRKSKKTPRPVDLQSVDEYVYDLQSSTLQDKKGHVKSGEQLLDDLFEKHRNTVHWLKGLRFRWQMSARELSITLISSSEKFLVWLLKTCFGRELEPSSMTTRILGQYKKEDMRILNSPSIGLLGYKASINVIVTFSIIMLTIIVVTYLLDIEMLSVILSNSVGLICFALLLLWILDRIVPRLMLWCINIVNRILLYHIFVKIKI